MDLELLLPVVAGASGMFAGCAVLYSKFRPQIPVKVNCHFCNTDTKVPYRNKESWVCTHCEQYNGFSEDGDYNRDIPSQYCEALNTPTGFHRSKTSSSPTLAIGNGLCQTCNLNQTLKLRALSDYTPINEDEYDREIEEYRKRLERTYALCRQCEATLHQTLGKQDSWLKPKLISYRLAKTAQNKDIFNHVPPLIHKLPLPLRILHLFGLMIATILLMANIHHLQNHSGTVIVSLDFGRGLSSYLKEVWRCTSAFVISGLCLLLATIFSSGKETLLVSDAISSFVWVGQLALTSSHQFIDPQEYNSLQVIVSFILVLMSMWVLLVPRRPASLMSPRSHQKKMRNLSDTNDSVGLEDSRNTYDASFSEELHNLSPSDSPPLPGTSQLNSTLKPNSILMHQNATFTANSTLQCSKNNADVDLDSTLGDLKISTPRKNNSYVRPGTPFSAKGLFSERNNSTSQMNESLYSYRNGNNESLLCPSRHPKTVTQSSWVAGGYWGNSTSPPVNGLQQHNISQFGGRPHGSATQFFPLSRSSSQSSGFVSLSNGDQLNQTNFHPQFQSDILGHMSAPNSRPGSICGGDYECNSVLSEPAYKSFGLQSTLLPSDSASNYGTSIRQRHHDVDARSAYSGTSFFSGSDATLRRPSSPTPSSSTFLFNPTSTKPLIGDISRNHSLDHECITNEHNVNVNKASGFNYRNPWIAFFLGMSIAGNIFLGVSLFSSKLNISDFLLSQFR
ncbi:unnamed protein product [Meganyctiphanes norvegica]|uniref:Ima1 N-terminal domain-containing protein n=1 Tax=Meganyctiphanes norvegica TaxID=48144 RepID=A0AAV2QRR0_MEGNR